MHATLTRVANSHEFLFFFLLQLCGVKIGLLWEVADSSAVLLQCWLQRVGWLPEWEGGRWLWTGVQDASSWGSCCTACTGFRHPGSSNLWGKPRSPLHLLTHPLPLLGVMWGRERSKGEHVADAWNLHISPSYPRLHVIRAQGGKGEMRKAVRAVWK